MANEGLARLFSVQELPDVQQSTSLITKLLGVKGRQGIRYSPVLVPGLDCSDLIMQGMSETLHTDTDITAAAGNVAGSAYNAFTVPNDEVWRLLDGAVSTDVLDADQSIVGLRPCYSDQPLTAGVPNGVLGGAGAVSAAASQIGLGLVLVLPFFPWLRPGGAVGFVLQQPAVLGVAAAIRINTRIRIARLHV
jgi:hypothetical protein